MKKILLFLQVLCFFCGCSSFDRESASEAERILQREQQMGQEMLEAFKKGDFESYLQYTPAKGKGQYGKKEFEKEKHEINSRMGEIVSTRFLTRLEMEPAHQLVWAVRFKSHTIEGKPVYREALYSIVVGEVDGTRKVFLFGFK